MSGIVMRLANRITYNITAPQAATTVQQVFARRVDVSKYQHGILVVRLHDATSWGALATIDTSWICDGFTDEDPGQNWSQPSAQVNTIASLQMKQGTDTAPMVKYGIMTDPLPPLLSFAFYFTAVAATTIKATLSCDLCLKGD